MHNTCRITDYFSVSDTGHILIDVRSPGEHQSGHIPGSVNIPLFSDDERAHVGTTYKTLGPEEAYHIGMDYVRPKLNAFIHEVKRLADLRTSLFIHCWRGGQRSAAFAQHLRNHGFENVSTIEGGYKAYRQYVLSQLSIVDTLVVIGGYTGSGKTAVLKALSEIGEQVIDLEELAAHKGSAFGQLKNRQQPTTEQFANNLFQVIKDMDLSRRIWVEDESVAIGQVRIPQEFFSCMRKAPILFMDIQRKVRALHLVKDYADLGQESLIESIGKISRKLGGQNAKEAIEKVIDKDYESAAGICLGYYDRLYDKGLIQRMALVQKIQLSNTNTDQNAQLLLDFCNKMKDYER